MGLGTGVLKSLLWQVSEILQGITLQCAVLVSITHLSKFLNLVQLKLKSNVRRMGPLQVRKLTILPSKDQGAPCLVRGAATRSGVPQDFSRLNPDSFQVAPTQFKGLPG